MRFRLSAILGLLLLVVVPLAVSKAYFATKEEMIQGAEAIAVVNITAVEKTETKGRHWTYSQAAKATVEQTLKGELPEHVMLYGGENFICARTSYQPGRVLVFLRRDEGLWVGSNWQHSVRPVDAKGMLGWYKPGGGTHLFEPQSLKAVLQEVKAVLLTP